MPEIVSDTQKPVLDSSSESEQSAGQETAVEALAQTAHPPLTPPLSEGNEREGLPQDDVLTTNQNLPEAGCGAPTPPEEIPPRETSISLEKYEDLQKERDDLYDRLLRKQAEFENFRKRMEREKQEFLELALYQFMKDIPPIIDSLERALNAPDGETVDNFKIGIELVLKQFREVLSSAGLQPIRAMGRVFDPNYHQAIFREENGRFMENEIIEEMQRGYTFKDRLLRPSMVKVAISPLPEVSAEKPIETEAC